MNGEEFRREVVSKLARLEERSKQQGEDIEEIKDRLGFQQWMVEGLRALAAIVAGLFGGGLR